MKKLTLMLMLLPALAFGQVADAPLADLPSVSVKLDEGQPAPFHGQLLSPTEQVRRGKVAERERAELLELKKPENVTLTKAALISIASGSAVLAAVITGLVVGFAKQPPTK